MEEKNWPLGSRVSGREGRPTLYYALSMPIRTRFKLRTVGEARVR